jgi:single-stranded-DNA-specific exonuclease
LDTIPEAVAVINPQISDEFAFKEICGATVALKVCLAIADKLACTQTQKQAILEEYLPYVSIATIADCMPLINENRLLVKK